MFLLTEHYVDIRRIAGQGDAWPKLIKSKFLKLSM